MIQSPGASQCSTYSANFHQSVQSKRKNSSEIVTDLKTSKKTLTLGDDDDYDASGGKLPLHGTIYQLKVLMLFVKRAIHGFNVQNKSEIKQFLLATDMDAAEKFDDVVVKFEKFGEFYLRFMQIKKKTEKRITLSDLKSTSIKNAFGLLKYFISYCKIMQNKLFEGAQIVDFSILTNTAFEEKHKATETKDPEILSTWEDFFHEEKGGLIGDDILYVETAHNKETKKYKLKPDTDIKRFFKNILIGSALEAKELDGYNTAQEKLQVIKILHFEYLITKVESIIADEENWKCKTIALNAAKEILVLNGTVLTSKECESFNAACKQLEQTKVKVMKYDIGNRSKKVMRNERQVGLVNAVKKLLDEANGVLETAKTNIKNATHLRNSYNDPQSNNSKLLNVELEQLQKSEMQLRKEIEADHYSQKKIEKLSQIVTILVALSDATFDKYFVGFAKDFRFITNYPDEEALGEIIKTELGATFHLLNADLPCDSFQNEILKFYKDYRNKKARFLSADDGRELFDGLERKICTLIAAGFSKAYTNELYAYGIHFDKEILKRLRERFILGECRIIRILSSNTRLTAVKVLQTLGPQYHDDYIFSDLKSLLDKNKFEYVVKSFKQNQIPLVIECRNDNYDTHEEVALKTELLKLICPSKRIILISSVDDKFSKDLIDRVTRKNNSRVYCDEVSDEETTFEDLDEDSQAKILQREVNFQGTSTNFNVIMNAELASTIINGSNLLDIMSEVILIGDEKPFSSTGYVKECFVNRQLYRHWIKIEILKEQSKLFFVTGINKEQLVKLKVSTDSIETLQDNESAYSYTRGIIVPEIDCKIHEEIFERLEWNAYWLEYHDGKKLFFLKRSVPLFRIELIDKYIDETEVLSDENIEKVNFSENCTIVVSDPGTGKTTDMTSVARKIKRLDSDNDKESKLVDTWIIRFDLNDYADVKHPQHLEKINFDDKSIEDAIELVIKMAVPDDFMNQSLVNLQREILKAALQTPEMIDEKRWKVPKIVMQFDGFDEIVPQYREKTTTLIKAIRSRATHLWINTRLHEKQFLEQELQLQSFNFKDFTVKDQVDCLQRSLKWHLKERGRIDLNDQINPTFVNEVLIKLNKLIENSNEFAHVPLHLAMLSEVIIENNLKLPQALGLFELFDKFDKIKLDIFEQKAKHVEGNQAIANLKKIVVPTIKKFHVYLSTKMMCPEMAVESEIEQQIDEYKGALIGVGQVTQKGRQLEFTHRCFPEYFFSHNLFDKIEAGQEFPIEKILLQKEFRTVRKFLNSRLGNTNKQYAMAEAMKICLMQHVKQRTEWTILHALSKEGNDKLLQFVLDNIRTCENINGNIVDKSTSDGQTPLHHAAYNGERETVEILLKNGADVNVSTSIGWTPIHVAAYNGHGDIVKILLDSGATIGPKSLEGYSPFYLAAQNGHTEVVSILLTNGASAIEKNTHGGTPLTIAADGGHRDTVRLLLGHVSDKAIDQPISDGRTALYIAAEIGHKEIVEMLLEARADVNVERTGNGFTPLIIAAYLDHSEVVQILLKYNATIDHISADYYTALHYAANNGHVDVIEILINNGAQVDAGIDEGITPLRMAARWGRTDAVRILLEYGASVDVEALDSTTPLFIAAEKGHKEVVELLLKANATVNTRPQNFSRSSLHVAMNKGHRNVVEAILEHNALKHGIALDNMTHLHYAATCGYVDIVKFLLTNGAEDGDGKTPLQIAHENGHTDIAEFLLEHGAEV